MSQIPIFIINLDDSKDRLEIISKKLDELGLEYERFPAVNGRKLSDNDIKHYFPNRYMWWSRRELLPGEIGCFMSHVNLFQMFVEKGIQRACVLEDDAIICPELMKWVRQDTPNICGSHILKLTLNPRDRKDNKGIFTQQHADRDIIFIPRKGVHGTYGYIITLEGARLALENLRIARNAIDHCMFEYWNSRLVTYHVYPPVVTTGEDSLIGQEARSKKNQRSTKPKTIWFTLRRQLRDISGFLKRQIFMLKVLGPTYMFRIKQLKVDRES